MGYSKRMGPPYDLQKYALSEKITRIKVVGVMKDYLLVTLTLNLILRSTFGYRFSQLRQDQLQTRSAKTRLIADPAS